MTPQWLLEVTEKNVIFQPTHAVLKMANSALARPRKGADQGCPEIELRTSAAG